MLKNVANYLNWPNRQVAVLSYIFGFVFWLLKVLHQVSKDPHCSLMKTFFWLNLELWCGKILDGNLNYTAISENDNIDPSLQRVQSSSIAISFHLNQHLLLKFLFYYPENDMSWVLRIFEPLFSLPFTFLCCGESQFMTGRVGNGATPKLSLSKVMIHESTKINIRRFCCSALKYYPRLSVTLCLARHER